MCGDLDYDDEEIEWIPFKPWKNLPSQENSKIICDKDTFYAIVLVCNDVIANLDVTLSKEEKKK